jgi:hypothetical protein
MRSEMVEPPSQFGIRCTLTIIRIICKQTKKGISNARIMFISTIGMLLFKITFIGVANDY